MSASKYLVTQTRLQALHQYVDAETPEAAIERAIEMGGLGVGDGVYPRAAWSTGGLGDPEYTVAERPGGGWDWER